MRFVQHSVEFVCSELDTKRNSNLKYYATFLYGHLHLWKETLVAELQQIPLIYISLCYLELVDTT